MEYEIGLFGRICVRRRGQVLATFPTKKTAELLLVLALHPDQPMTRKDIIGLLWPGAKGSKANNRLSATLYMLRRALEDEFGDEVASAIQAGDGSLWLNEDMASETRLMEAAWTAFRMTEAVILKSEHSALVTERYLGHLGADLNAHWVDPVRSLWASRWTECVLWRAQNEVVTVDQAIARLSRHQPIMPVTRTLVIRYGTEIGRNDLVASWAENRDYSPATRSQTAHYQTFYNDDFGRLARRPMMTAVVVESAAIPLLREIVAEAQPTYEWNGHPQIFCARNALFARRLVAKIRMILPMARIYVSTEVAELEVRDDDRLLSWIPLLQPGETRMNAASAALIQQHDESVVMERPLGRLDYRLM